MLRQLFISFIHQSSFINFGSSFRKGPFFDNKIYLSSRSLMEQLDRESRRRMEFFHGRFSSKKIVQTNVALRNFKHAVLSFLSVLSNNAWKALKHVRI